MYHSTISLRVIKKKKTGGRAAEAQSPPRHQLPTRSQFENNYFTEMCSGSQAGSYLRLIDFVYHSTLDWRVIKKKRRQAGEPRKPKVRHDTSCVQRSGFGVQGLGFGFRVEGLRFRV